jgi:hypothetical protein
MRLEGKKIEGPNVETIVIPRTDGRPDIVFKAQAVLDYSGFDDLCPRPTPPIKMLRGGERQADLEDPTYKELISTYGLKRMAWMCIKSLEVTPTLEWERVDLGNPNTWLKFEDELTESGFSDPEIMRIRNGIFSANCLNENLVELARQSFFSGRPRTHDPSSYLPAETNGTPSGEPASDSESAHQEFSEIGISATTGSKPA